MYNENLLKAINLSHLDTQITISENLISHTNFQQGQLLQTYFYGNMIMIVPVVLETKKLLN